jgi:uncharacterized protein
METNKIEWREGVEIRETSTAPIQTDEYLEGYAVVFEQRSTGLQDRYGRKFTEIIKRGAFSQSMKSNNVSLVFLHSDNAEYADTDSGTLTLTEDDKGIQFRAKLPPYAKTLRSKVGSGAVKGMSIGMIVQDADYQQDGTRVVKRADLFHISPVYSPAYETEIKLTKTSNLPSMKMQIDLQNKNTFNRLNTV